MPAVKPRATVYKNGKPVKKFWQEKVKKADPHFPTTYPIYFSGDGDTVWELTEDKAPRTLSQAIETARLLVEDPNQPQTHARIYELRAVHRVGVEFDWTLYRKEELAKERAEETEADSLPDPAPAKLLTFRRISTTASEVD